MRPLALALALHTTPQRCPANAKSESAPDDPPRRFKPITSPLFCGFHPAHREIVTVGTVIDEAKSSLWRRNIAEIAEASRVNLTADDALEAIANSTEAEFYTLVRRGNPACNTGLIATIAGSSIMVNLHPLTRPRPCCPPLPQNGYTYCNAPDITIRQGQIVRWCAR